MFPVADLQAFRRSLLAYAASFPYACLLDNCQSETDAYGSYEILAGFSSGTQPLSTDWPQWLQTPPDGWQFGALSYDLKNRLEPHLANEARSSSSFPEIAFFSAERVLALPRNSREAILWGDWPEAEVDRLRHALLPDAPTLPQPPGFQSNFTPEAYCQAVARLQNLIREGDFYEINLSQRYAATAPGFSPEHLFLRLTEIQPVPFAAYLKLGSLYAVCGSPERFLRHENGLLTTQPIKGTARKASAAAEDQRVKEKLLASEKERAENLMIVDLARNDLSRTCAPGTVKPVRLLEVQSFRTLHHLVSTVQGRLENHSNPWQALAAAFPPGSMTGAPKIRAMERIAEAEHHSRGLYAGSIGYQAPDGTFDFNVVIRTLLYEAESGELSYHVGGAITHDSEPEAEYRETLVKAEAIRRIFFA